MAGSVDSGKSTLVACLTHGAAGRPLLDNGRGSARMAVRADAYVHSRTSRDTSHRCTRRLHCIKKETACGDMRLQE